MPKKKSSREMAIRIGLLVVTILLMLAFGEIVSKTFYGNHITFDYGNDWLWEMKPNQQGFTLPNNKFATINSLGFRNIDFSAEKPEGTFRIAMVGDSYTFGFGVHDNETLPYQLEQALQQTSAQVEILNFGVPGYGLYQTIPLYKQKISNYNPDLIILTLIESASLRQPEPASTLSVARQVIRGMLRKSTLAAIAKPYLTRFRWVLFGGNVKEDELRYNQLIDADLARLNSLIEFIENQNLTLVIVPYLESEDQNTYLGKIHSTTDYHNNVIVVDNLLPTMKRFAEENPNTLLQIPRDGHPTPTAYTITTKVIVDKLQKGELIPT